ncbi:MAG: YebC/PmpR family DNA-binding transcriptional regulator [Dehalococcoidia bacterium]|nr:putative transcriptional regulatory protein [Chloroflexota bacterium]MBT9160908.1 putative transcriptional regulatory protein [Chloroflexota bacterium]MBT9161743.1 putative transcriptional regulatory protein [Chloroflexota bacterium]
MSGHSKWSTIKRQKGVADARRGQLFTRLGREITIAARDGGGDPQANAALRLAVQRARDSNMPRENIERAIKRGTGSTEAAALFEMTLEGYGPGGAAILLRIVTDNRNRTISEVRSTLTRSNSTVGESGCVTWVFDQKGVITVDARSDTEDLALAAIDAGAEDVKVEDNLIEIYTRPENLEKTRKGLEEGGVTISSAELTLIPQNLIKLEEKDALQTLKLLDKLEEIDGVQHVFTNADFPDGVVRSYRSG